MRILALDSTTRAGSVALIVSDEDVVCFVDERAGDESRTHAERLPADLLAVLAAHGLKPSAIDLFAVASGPGLFTGLRVGVATMQGFSLVEGKPLIGVSALDAIAHLASRDAAPNDLVAAWMNAHRKDVFTSLYVVGAAPVFDVHRVEQREGPGVGDPASTLARWIDIGAAPALLAGDGALLYRDLIAARLPDVRIVDTGPLAAAIGLQAKARHRRGERGSAAGVVPLYVRRPDAELARDHALADRSAHLDRSD
jgi:tRNA threonylcarbamoyladenosine biosynthesis protein TsaB